MQARTSQVTNKSFQPRKVSGRCGPNAETSTVFVDHFSEITHRFKEAPTISFVWNRELSEVPTGKLCNFHHFQVYRYLSVEYIIFSLISCVQQRNYLHEMLYNPKGEINPDIPIDEQTQCLPYDPKWEFPRERLKLGKKTRQITR